MKRFTSLLMAAVVALASFAAVPAQKAHNLKIGAQKQMVQKAGKIDAPRTIDAGQIRKAPKSADDYVVITDQPEGELKTFVRSGGHYYVSSGSLYYGDQSGTIDIVFGAENKVFFKDIISGLAYGSWVEGTLSEDGKTITVALGQNLRYVSTYDACVALKVLVYNSGFSVDETATEVTFTVSDDGVLSLQGTGFTSVSLAGVWTDDGTIQNYGDYESVYTPFIPNTDLVTLPEGLEVVEKPITGMYYAGISAYSAGTGEEVNATVKVAKDGDDVYIQGLVQLAPEAWVKGTLVDGEVEIPVTYLGEAGYAMGYSSSEVVGVSLIYLADLDSYEVNGYVMVSDNELENTMTAIYEGLFIGQRPALVELPEGLTPVAYPISGTNSDGEALSGSVNVAADSEGNVYIQGLAPEAPEGWIKGAFNEAGDTAIFAKGQYLGVGDNYGCSIYLLAAEEDEDENVILKDLIFAYDAVKNIFIAQDIIYENAGRTDKVYFVDYFEDVVLGTLSDGFWVAAEQGYDNEQDLTAEGFSTTEMGNGIIGTFAQNDGTNAPKYYESDKSARLYAGNTLTITSPKPMAQIIINFPENATSAREQLEANVGEYTLEDHVGTWNGEANEVIFTAPSGKQGRIVKIQIFFFDYSTTLVTLPEGIETSAYALEAHDSYYDSAVTGETQVGFNADSTVVYIQGLSSYLPKAWVKGTIAEDGTVTIPNWLMGTYESWFGDYNLVFSGATFQYDKEADKFVSEEGFYTVDVEEGYGWDELDNVILSKMNEVAAIPADPEFKAFNYVDTNYPNVEYVINTVDIEGNDLVTSKLSYVFWLDKEGAENIEQLVLTTDLYEELSENMSEIPYGFTDSWDIYKGKLYLNQSEEEILTWMRLGLQSIYRGAGEENKSNIVWYDVRKYFIDNGVIIPEGIEDAEDAVKAVKVLENGTLFIEKNGVRFNAIGTRVK